MTRIKFIDYRASLSLPAETQAKLRAALDVYRDDLPALEQARYLARQSQQIGQELEAVIEQIPKRLRARQVVMSISSVLPAPKNLVRPETDAEKQLCERADALVAKLEKLDSDAGLIITLLHPGIYRNKPVENMIDGQRVVRDARHWLQRVEAYAGRLRDPIAAEKLEAAIAPVAQALDQLDSAVKDLPPFMNGRVLRTEHGVSATLIEPLAKFERAAGILSGQVSRTERGL